MYKFRSMCVGAEKTGTGQYSFKNDPRVTKVGRFLRATSIDELPQLVNILKGDMSLIGFSPAAYIPSMADRGVHAGAAAHVRAAPGITGWAQVHGRKGVDWDERIRMSVYYVDHVSFLLDVKIFFMTIWKVFSNADNENVGTTVKTLRRRSNRLSRWGSGRMERFQIEPLRSGLTELLAAHGVPQKQARTLLDSMLAADLRGVHTHGLAVLPAYLSKIDRGGFALGEKTEVLRQTAAFAVVDAKGQLGAVSASDCMALALEGARRSGLFAVFCRNANTFGPAFLLRKNGGGSRPDRRLLLQQSNGYARMGRHKKAAGHQSLFRGRSGAQLRADRGRHGHERRGEIQDQRDPQAGAEPFRRAGRWTRAACRRPIRLPP